MTDRYDPSGISFHANWWGFKIGLTEGATEIVEDVARVSAILAELFGGDFPVIGQLCDVIAAYLNLYRSWVEEVDQAGGNQGVYLVSPWIYPTLLVPVSAVEHVDDTKLYWAVYDPNNGWGEAHPLPAQHSAVGVGLVLHGDRVVCVHRGPGDDSLLYMTSKQAGSNANQGGRWTRAEPVYNCQTHHKPALVSMGGVLYCYYTDAGTGHICYTTYDELANGWTEPVWWRNTSTQSGPAAAVVSSEPSGYGLVIMHRGGNNDLFVAQLPTTAPPPQSVAWEQLAHHCTSAEPALLDCGSWGYLCVHKGRDDDNLWWFSKRPYEGYGHDVVFLSSKTSAGPTLFARGGDNVATCMHRGHGGDEQLYVNNWNGPQAAEIYAWRGDQPLPWLNTVGAPAVIQIGTGNLAVFRGVRT